MSNCDQTKVWRWPILKDAEALGLDEGKVIPIECIARRALLADWIALRLVDFTDPAEGDDQKRVAAAFVLSRHLSTCALCRILYTREVKESLAVELHAKPA